MSDEESRKDAARSIAPNGWDMGPATFRDELRELLRGTIADTGTHLDSGGGDGQADLWVTCGGVEFFITVQRSGAQLARDKKARE